MLLSNLAEDTPEICGQSKIAALVQLIVLQPWPIAIDLSAANCVTHDEHRIGVSVIGAAVAVLSYGATELRHRQDHNIIHPRAEVSVQSRNCLTELPQQVAELSLLVTFIHVRIPTADVGERDFQAHPGFDELRDLQQRISKWRAWIRRTIFSLVLRWVHLLQIINGLEGFLACAMQSVLDELV